MTLNVKEKMNAAGETHLRDRELVFAVMGLNGTSMGLVLMLMNVLEIHVAQMPGKTQISFENLKI